MNDQANPPVLELAGIEKGYMRGTPGEVAVLRGVDLTLRAGEAVALVAPSGAGKSTLLHIAGLLDTPDAGRIAIAGQDVTGQGDRLRTLVRRRDVGFIYQFHHLLPEFTAAENVILPQLANGTTRTAAAARANDLLSRVGLSERQAHRPAELSGGEQQRVALARAAAPRPKLFLADEPTGNLDESNGRAIMDMLFSLRDRHGATLVLVTHAPELAQRCDRVIRLRDGRIDTGEPADTAKDTAKATTQTSARDAAE